MLAKNKTIQKLVSCLIIISLLTPAVFMSIKPKKAEAFLGFGDIVFDPIHTATTVKIVAQEIFKQFLMLAARKMLNKMTQSTIGWINSGFHGNPLYLENAQSFFKDIAKSEVKNIINTYGYNSLKYPFGKNFALNTIETYKRKVEDNASYSLSTITNDPILLNNYRNNFSTGGWNGFLTNTQYPQNNYVGFQMTVNDRLAGQLEGTSENAAQKIKTALQQAGGFLSPQVCPTNSSYNNGINEFQRPEYTPIEYNHPPAQYEGDTDVVSALYIDQLKDYNDTWKSQNDKKKSEWAADNTCPGGLVSTTPGGVVGQQIKDALGSSGRRGELAQALGNSVAAILDTLMNSLLDKGLNSLGKVGQTNEQGQPLIPPDDDTTLDNFYYGGQNYNTVGNGDAGDYTGPKNPPDSPKEVLVVNGPDRPIPVKIIGGGTTGGDECSPVPTPAQKEESQNAVDFIVPLLEAIPKMNPIVTPPPAEYQAAVRDAMNQTDSKFPGVVGNYYPAANDMGMLFTYIIGPATIVDSNQVGIGDTWRPVWRVTCDGTQGTTTGTGNSGGTSTNGGGANQNPNPGLPYIKSVSPATANGGETMTINGFDLSSTVRFSSNVNGKAQTVGGASVSADKTRVTVTIPTGMTFGATSVQDIVATDSKKFSNSVIITIGDSGVEPIATVSSVDNITIGGGGHLAYNATNKTWLVVSGPEGGGMDHISGRIMGNDLTPIGSEINIADIPTGGGGSPKVAFSPDLNKYLVVWIGFPDARGGTIYGRFVTADGTPTGNTFIIYKDAGGEASFFAVNSPLNYDPVNKKFVFAWELWNPGHNINLITIDQTGAVGPAVGITQGQSIAYGVPSMTVNTRTGKYCVAYTWYTDLNGGWTRYEGIKEYNVASNTLGSEIIVTSQANKPLGSPSIIYNSVDNKYLLAWDTGGPTTGEQGKILTSCSGASAGNIITLKTGIGAGIVSHNSQSNRYAIIGQDWTDSGNSYSILNSSGSTISSGVAFVGGFGNFGPVVAPNTSNGTFAAISSIEFKRTRFTPNINP